MPLRAGRPKKGRHSDCSTGRGLRIDR